MADHPQFQGMRAFLAQWERSGKALSAAAAALAGALGVPEQSAAQALELYLKDKAAAAPKPAHPDALQPASGGKRQREEAGGCGPDEAAGGCAPATAAAAAAAAAAEAKAVALEEQMSCSVCLSLLFEPVTSPCSHSLCWTCLARVVKTSCACPECRASLPRNSSAWRVNARLVSIMEANAGPGWRAEAPTLRLHAAFRDGPEEAAVALLLSSGAQVSLHRHARGQPLLHLALARKWDRALTLLLGRGVDVNERDSSGRPPLDLAPEPITARRLLDAGATAATAAALLHVVEHSIRGSDDKSQHIDATAMRVLALLPKPWAPLGPHSGELRRALYASLKSGHRRTTLALLRGGVAPCPTLFAPFPPLHLAAGNADLEACRLLAALDPAALARRNVLQQTALHHAAAAGRHAAASLLRELGARVHDEPDLHGNSMLNYAARWLAAGGGGAGAQPEGSAVWAQLLKAERGRSEAPPAPTGPAALRQDGPGHSDSSDE
jgi:hypothetical protein